MEGVRFESNQTARLCINVRFLQDLIVWPKCPVTETARPKRPDRIGQTETAQTETAQTETVRRKRPDGNGQMETAWRKRPDGNGQTETARPKGLVPSQ